jgi:hypothetical protein
MPRAVPSRPVAPASKPTISFNGSIGRQGVAGTATVKVPVAGGSITGSAGFSKEKGKPVNWNANISGSNISLPALK